VLRCAAEYELGPEGGDESEGDIELGEVTDDEDGMDADEEDLLDEELLEYDLMHFGPRPHLVGVHDVKMRKDEEEMQAEFEAWVHKHTAKARAVHEQYRRPYHPGAVTDDDWCIALTHAAGAAAALPGDEGAATLNSLLREVLFTGGGVQERAARLAAVYDEFTAAGVTAGLEARLLVTAGLWDAGRRRTVLRVWAPLYSISSADGPSDGNGNKALKALKAFRPQSGSQAGQGKGKGSGALAALHSALAAVMDSEADAGARADKMKAIYVDAIGQGVQPGLLTHVLMAAGHADPAERQSALAAWQGQGTDGGGGGDGNSNPDYEVTWAGDGDGDGAGEGEGAAAREWAAAVMGHLAQAARELEDDADARVGVERGANEKGPEAAVHRMNVELHDIMNKTAASKQDRLAQMQAVHAKYTQDGMAHGAWRMAHGSWRMAHGAWLMARAVCCTAGVVGDLATSQLMIAMTHQRQLYDDVITMYRELLAAKEAEALGAGAGAGCVDLVLDGYYFHSLASTGRYEEAFAHWEAMNDAYEQVVPAVYAALFRYGIEFADIWVCTDGPARPCRSIPSYPIPSLLLFLVSPWTRRLSVPTLLPAAGAQGGAQRPADGKARICAARVHQHVPPAVRPPHKLYGLGWAMAASAIMHACIASSLHCIALHCRHGQQGARRGEGADGGGGVGGGAAEGRRAGKGRGPPRLPRLGQLHPRLQARGLQQPRRHL
jgi:hypothetical protein